ncbi:hypothetical protein RUND412_003762 [Rhizina undulata]
MRRFETNTMTTTSLFPKLVSLPSPTPSVTNIEDLSITGLQLLIRPHNHSTISPPESFTTADDTREYCAHEHMESALPKVKLGEELPQNGMPSRGKRRTQKKTYSKHNCRGKKRPSPEDDAVLPTEQNEEFPSPPAKRAKVVGLKNLGNTCYNNAVIQALSHTRLLREYFLDRKLPSLENGNSEGQARMEDVSIQVRLHMPRPRTRRAAQLEEQMPVTPDINLCNEFARLLKLMWQDNSAVEEITRKGSRVRRGARSTSVVSPHAFASAVSAVLPLFQERYEQQDAQEFLRCALERMQNELIAEKIESADNSAVSEDDIRKNEDTIVKGVFGGILWNKIVCMSCDKYTIKPDPFLDLSLVIPEIQSLSNHKTAELAKIVTLEDCLDLFSSAEELERSPSPPASSASSNGGSCGRSCQSCGSDAGFSKAFKFGELPRVLCIHLKRFRWRRNGIRGGKQKVDLHVKFPLENLDMGRWSGDDDDQHIQELYDLYAVVVHQGSGANSGHYYAYVKHDGEWWSINDDRASRVSPEIVAKAKAYLLFYSKKEQAVPIHNLQPSTDFTDFAQ